MPLQVGVIGSGEEKNLLPLFGGIVDILLLLGFVVGIERLLDLFSA
jgi:hypothetical protein